MISAIGGQQSALSEKAEWVFADSWIWARLYALVRDVERLFQAYQYGEAGRQSHEFFWNDFADWYVEVAKLQMQKAETREEDGGNSDTVGYVSAPAASLHSSPRNYGGIFARLSCAPHSQSSRPAGRMLIVATWPEAHAEEGRTRRRPISTPVQEVIRTIRNLRADKKVSPARRLPGHPDRWSEGRVAHGKAPEPLQFSGLDPSLLTILASLDTKPENSIALVAGPVEIYIPLAGMLDMEEERKRLEKELFDIQVQIDRLEKLLGSDFANKAPAAVVQKEQISTGSLPGDSRKTACTVVK